MEKEPIFNIVRMFYGLSNLSTFHKAEMNNVKCRKVNLHFSFHVGATLLNLPDLCSFHQLTANELHQ